jgi:hypothetical protein
MPGRAVERVFGGCKPGGNTVPAPTTSVVPPSGAAALVYEANAAKYPPVDIEQRCTGLARNVTDYDCFGLGATPPSSPSDPTSLVPLVNFGWSTSSVWRHRAIPLSDRSIRQSRESLGQVVGAAFVIDFE